MTKTQWVKCKLGYHTVDPLRVTRQGWRICLHCNKPIEPKPDRQEQRRIEMVAKQKEWLTNPWDQ